MMGNVLNTHLDLYSTVSVNHTTFPNFQPYDRKKRYNSIPVTS